MTSDFLILKVVKKNEKQQVFLKKEKIFLPRQKLPTETINLAITFGIYVDICRMPTRITWVVVLQAFIRTIQQNQPTCYEKFSNFHRKVQMTNCFYSRFLSLQLSVLLKKTLSLVLSQLRSTQLVLLLSTILLSSTLFLPYHLHII